MPDIFISYSSEDKSQVKQIAYLLEQRGFTVWWDRDIPFGQHFDSVIEKELNNAKCVLVIWTERSIASEWVKNEASEAARQGRLLPIQLQKIKLPLAFRRIETAQLIGWQGEPDHPELEILLKTIADITQKKKTTAEHDRSKPPDYIIPGYEKDKVLSVKGYAVIAAGGLLVSAFAVYYYLHSIQGKVNEQVDQRIFYLILILFGIAVSAIVFGLMNSYGMLKKERPNAKLLLTGPAVGVLLIVLGGFFLPKGNTEKIVTIRVFNKNKVPLIQGEVKLYFNEYIRTQSIDKTGQAQFAGVPDNFLNTRNQNRSIQSRLCYPADRYHFTRQQGA